MGCYRVIIIANIIPSDHVDDLPIVEPIKNPIQFLALAIPEPALVDENEEPEEEEEFEDEEEFEEENPQEKEYDMEVDIEEEENKPELIFPYVKAGPLNPLPPAFDSENEDVIEVEDTVDPKDETVPASVYEVGESSTASFHEEDSDVCGREMAHALVKKKGKAKDKYYGKLILDLGNEVRSSMEEGMVTMENLVRKLGNAEEKAECKELKKELEESRDQVTAPVVQEFTFAGFMKCNPDNFRGTEGPVELRRWFEKTEMTFGISKCVKDKKVKFAATTL
ncbi:hypothetical protein Tco_1275843 [Tanacetum coccineum]